MDSNKFIVFVKTQEIISKRYWFALIFDSGLEARNFLEQIAANGFRDSPVIESWLREGRK